MTKQRVRELEIMLQGQGSDPAQRATAMLELRKIVEETDGTTVAKKARAVLAAQERSREEERDPALEAYSRRWSVVQGLTDPNIVRLLRELKANPALAVRLRGNVVRDVRKWIETILPQISEKLVPQDVETLNAFVCEVSQIDAYRVDEIVPLRRSLFQLRYQDRRRQIDAALNRWAIQEAWQLHAELSPTPDEFAAEVRQITDRMYEVEKVRQTVEEALRQLSRAAPSKWLDVGMLISSLRSSNEYLEGTRLPPEWRQKIADAIDRATLASRTFLKKEASLAVDPTSLREFWRGYTALDLVGDVRLTPEDEWFSNGLSAIVKNARLEIADADSPEALKAVGRKLGDASVGVPPPVADRMGELAGAIDAHTANWLAMIAGEEFHASTQATSDLPVPRGFVRAEAEYRAVLDQIHLALTAIDVDPSSGRAPAEDAYRGGVEIAKSIVARFAKHAGALKLQKEAERGLLCWRLDEALRQWRIDEFLTQMQAGRAEGVYRDLASNPAALRAFAELAGQADLQGWRDAAEWWKRWRERKRSVPVSESDWPNSLETAVREQEERRRDQWYAALDRLIGARVEPDEAQEAAESLRRELQSLSLQGYYQTLTREAAAARADRYIDAEQFDHAEAEIKGLDEYHEETLRLRTRLNVERVRTCSVAETADVLFREWQNVVRYLPDAPDILLDTVGRAWELEDVEALKNLSLVLDRAIKGGVMAADKVEPLGEWNEWLKVEQAIRPQQSLRSVERLADYLRRAEKSDRGDYMPRLQRLARYWETSGNIVMLAWAYQAFNRLDPSVLPWPRDPVEDLIAEGAAVGRRVLEALRSIDAGEAGPPTPGATPDGMLFTGNLDRARQLREDVRSLTAQLEGHQAKWNELNNYLTLLHYEEHRGTPAHEFAAAQQLGKRLEQALDDLFALRDADWRKGGTLEKVDAVRRTVMSRFDGLAVQPRLLAQIEHWDPLTRLRFLEARIVEAAEACNSVSQVEIYEERHFADLKHSVDKLIRVLMQAGANHMAMWQSASVDYWDLVRTKAGILKSAITPPDLQELADCVDRLMKEEQEFKRKIAELTEAQPIVLANSRFDPQLHLDYLKRFPVDAPGSRKVYRRFERFAISGPMQMILKASRAHLPQWVRKYLDEGIP